MSQKTRRLGRGLSSLIQTHAPVPVETIPVKDRTFSPEVEPGRRDRPTTQQAVPSDANAAGVRLVAVEAIRPSPFQPRRHFDEAALAQLASSIARSGVMQPVIVRALAGDRFELVAGERRWRASKLAGLAAVPALVRELTDEESAEWGIVENVQREDLNPMERAHGLRAIAERFGLGHAELGERVGLDRSSVTNLIRLTELEEEIQSMVGEGRLSMGHARALLGVGAGASRVRLAKRAAAESWSVRRIEAAVREGSGSKEGLSQSTNAGQTQRAVILSDLERRIAAHLGTKARIDLHAKGNRGRLVVEFFSLEHFEDVMRRIGLPDEETV